MIDNDGSPNVKAKPTMSLLSSLVHARSSQNGSPVADTSVTERQSI
jgi:hypothetical protein